MNQHQVPAWAAFISQDLRLHHANRGAVRITQRDLWRNVRIPFIHSLPAYKSEQLEWISIQSNTIPDYSSLIGVPIRGFPARRSGNASSVVETSYQTVIVSSVLKIP
jgi:hypothetical protein